MTIICKGTGKAGRSFAFTATLAGALLAAGSAFAGGCPAARWPRMFAHPK